MILFIGILLFSLSNGIPKDGMTYSNKLRLKDMIIELHIEARYKLRQVRYIARTKYSFLHSYSVGLIMGTVLENYRTMVYLSYQHGRQHGMVQLVKKAKLLEIEIDELVELLHKIPPKFLLPDTTWYEQNNTIANATSTDKKTSRRKMDYRPRTELDMSRNETEAKFRINLRRKLSQIRRRNAQSNSFDY